ncbi:hypothetical protein [Mitsuaria sp. 7]|uniref:hypothetical protein n=1 Tax=Mitsuaria sp. 7 TaxID=1658665 RepID=UPI0012F75C35|nr:hypothetical protein [Mitsuaria sp. 7]
MDKFGELLVRSLRDRAIEQHEMLLAGALRGKDLQALQQRVASLSPELKSLLRELVLDALDVALHDVLLAFQSAHDRDVGVEVLVNGTNAAEHSGMLHGELFGPDGWVARFSRYPRDVD